MQLNLGVDHAQLTAKLIGRSDFLFRQWRSGDVGAVDPGMSGFQAGCASWGEGDDGMGYGHLRWLRHYGMLHRLAYGGEFVAMRAKSNPFTAEDAEQD